MLSVLLSLPFLAQVQVDPSLSRLPPKRDPYRLCQCEEETREVMSMSGLVRDAELLLGSDGLSVLPRQGTKFDLISADDETLRGVIQIWHDTRPSRCGVSFEYGKVYTVRYVENEGQRETNWCLDPRREEVSASSGDAGQDTKSAE